MPHKTKKLFKYDFKVMGCPCQVQLYCDDKRHYYGAKNAVLRELRRLDNYYTNYADTSFTSKMNSMAGSGQGIVVDDETAALLDYSQECFIQSQGLFDITAGTLRKAWNYHSLPHRLPNEDELKPLMKAVGWDKVEWKRPHLKLPISGMVLDFGGVVKEYAADVAAGICYQHDIHHGLIDLSGDIRILGPHADGKPWSIGIKNPAKPREDIAVVFQENGAIVTSGNYERCILVDGKRYSHILNPKTGWPVDGFSSVTIMGDYCLVAGSAATIASLKTQVEAVEWLNELGLPYICIDGEGKMHRNC